MKVEVIYTNEIPNTNLSGVCSDHSRLFMSLQNE